MATFYKSDSIPDSVADLLTVARPVDTLVINNGILYRSASTDTVSYEVIATGSSGTLTPSLTAISPVTAVSPTNVFPLDLFTGEATTTVTAPATGTFLARITAGISHTGVSGGGTTVALSFQFQFTVAGVATGDILTVTSGLADADLGSVSVAFEQPLTLTSGQLVGVNWGLGGVNGWTAVSQAGRTLSLTPTS